MNNHNVVMKAYTEVCSCKWPIVNSYESEGGYAVLMSNQAAVCMRGRRGGERGGERGRPCCINF